MPRAGGVLDQPGNEMLYLNAVLEAFANYEELEHKRDEARAKSRQKAAQGS